MMGKHRRAVLLAALAAVAGMLSLAPGAEAGLTDELVCSSTDPLTDPLSPCFDVDCRLRLDDCCTSHHPVALLESSGLWPFCYPSFPCERPLPGEGPVCATITPGFADPDGDLLVVAVNGSGVEAKRDGSLTVLGPVESRCQHAEIHAEGVVNVCVDGEAGA